MERRAIFSFCLLFAVIHCSLAFNSSLVGLGFDTECNNAFVATASLVTPHFTIRRMLSFFPHAGFKHPKLPLYYAITVHEDSKLYLLYTIDLQTWNVVRNVTLHIEGRHYIDSMKLDPSSGLIVALCFKDRRNTTMFDLDFVTINPTTGKMTTLVRLSQVKHYLYSSGSLDMKSRLYSFLIRDYAAELKLVKIDLEYRRVTLISLSGHKFTNSYYLFMQHFQGQLYGLGAILAPDSTALHQTLFKMDIVNGNITVVAQLDGKWNCDALSFVVNNDLGFFSVELDEQVPEKICFLDRQEVIQVMNFDGKVIRSLEYHNFPLVFSFLNFL